MLKNNPSLKPRKTCFFNHVHSDSTLKFCFWCFVLSLGTRCVSSLSSSTASLLRLRIWERIWESNGAHDYIVLYILLAVEVYIYIELMLSILPSDLMISIFGL